jgi:HSP20 family protein
MPSPLPYGVDPFHEMRRIQDEMNRVLQRTPQRESGYPAMNVYVSQDGVAVTAELPGVSEEDLEVSVHRDTVTLRGERKLERDEVSRYHRRERGGSSFARTVSLPFNVDPDKVEASYRNGVLRLSLHRPESDRPKRIPVRSS